ncbi:hypothetical protein LVJ82_12980 [Vitreoscilla massiliensis]|uniref:Uncharacterized protein n=1 Tax=Vitreoscilla massiliensis TaxID=1689272 RepID=A0ABY4DXY7_9NEIS|nr:hypothetical protein [Vitreoscilla massiliensis]UOO88381.1 hypothetical protein LVJ82_12980 [Vitreoscilla massiliensis]
MHDTHAGQGRWSGGEDNNVAESGRGQGGIIAREHRSESPYCVKTAHIGNGNPTIHCGAENAMPCH